MRPFLLRTLTIAVEHHQPGQAVVEYGIIIATIPVVVWLGVTAFGNQIKRWFERLAAHITTVGT
jgi:Flp pilus assembly pilin Flp